MKHFERTMLGLLSREETRAVIGALGSTWVSQRDHLLLGLVYNAGARDGDRRIAGVADVVWHTTTNR